MPESWVDISSRVVGIAKGFQCRTGSVVGEGFVQQIQYLDYATFSNFSTLPSKNGRDGGCLDLPTSDVTMDRRNR